MNLPLVGEMKNEMEAYLRDADVVLKRIIPMWTQSNSYDGIIPYVELGAGIALDEFRAGICGLLAEEPFMREGTLTLAWSVTIGRDISHAQFHTFRDAVAYAVKEISGRFAASELGLYDTPVGIPFLGEPVVSYEITY